MKTKIAGYFVMLLLAASLLAACAPGQASTPNFAPTPPAAPTRISTLGEVGVPTALPVPAVINVDCTDWALIDVGEYQAQNNTWGKGTLSGWSQCIGLETNPDESVAGRWTWDWPKSGNNVKAYPEIVFGQKPGSASTAASLPLLVREVGSAAIVYDVTTTFEGSANLAFDLWLTSTPNPDSFGVPPITHEIMIWLDGENEMAPGGSIRERIEMDGTRFRVYVGEKYGDGWRYVAFVSDTPRLAGTLDLAPFLAYLQEKELVTGDEYLASIEFGNEVASGKGETILHQYQVTIEKKTVR